MSPGAGPTPAGERRRLLRLAAAAVVLVAAATVLVFTKPDPFTDHVRMEGVFSSVNGLREGGAVRVAGLDVGRVEEIRPGPDHTSLVVMQLDDDAVRPRADARLQIRPRLVLEGNSYVDIRLGSPSAPPLRDGARIPLARTAVSVALDQVLSTFTEPVRGALQRMTGELAAGLGEGTDGGTSGARALRRSVRELDDALGSVQSVSRAVQGTRSGDLTSAVAATGEVTEQLARDDAALRGIVSSYARVSGVLAARDEALGRSIRSAAALLSDAPSDLRAIDRVLPVATRTARRLQPALREAGPTLRSTDAALDQIAAVVRPSELPGLLRELRPLSRDLAPLLSRLRRTAPRLRAVTDCLGTTVVPALNQKVPDGMHTTGDPAWLDLLHAGASLAASSPNFDGNGTTIRLGITESEQAVQGFLPGLGTLEGAGSIRGMNPEWLGVGVDPPTRPDAVCAEQALPDLGARASTGPDWLKPVVRDEPSGHEARRLRSLMRKITGLTDFGDTTLRAAPHRPARRPTTRPLPTTEGPASTAPDAAGPPRAPSPSLGKGLADAITKLLPMAPQTPPREHPDPGESVRSVLDGILGRGR